MGLPSAPPLLTSRTSILAKDAHISIPIWKKNQLCSFPFLRLYSYTLNTSPTHTLYLSFHLKVLWNFHVSEKLSLKLSLVSFSRRLDYLQLASFILNRTYILLAYLPYSQGKIITFYPQLLVSSKPLFGRHCFLRISVPLYLSKVLLRAVKYFISIAWLVHWLTDWVVSTVFSIEN